MAKKYIKRCSKSLITREMQIKTTMSYQYHPVSVRMLIIKKTNKQKIKSVGEGVERRESQCTVGRDVNWQSHVENSIEVPQKFKIELPYDPAIPILGIHPKKRKTLIQKDTCTPMPTAALSTIGKTRKQPKQPSKGEWIKKMRRTHTHTHTHTRI